MKSKEIRKKFFDFFNKHGHETVASSSLIPAQDPTLLFANAGMNQFKDVFLGLEKRSYTRAVSIQKCVRAGGKHNDLDNVGFTKRHLTFFEMMGNFSFNDYFKKEAIQFAWDFLTKEMNISTENMHVSVFETDDESYNIWRDQINVPEDRIHRLGESENFWSMGDTGPCGPCTEIHVDRGPEFGCKEMCNPACECDRFLEIWNVVFMQYDRQANGEQKPLKATGVDTGMGLERLCSIIQNVDNVFETDLFIPIIKKIEELTGQTYADKDAKTKASFHVIADHIRSSTLIISDGGAPSNEGRGYVLRKIIRRAALFVQKLTDKNIFPELSQFIVEDLGDIYPDLKTNAKLIYKILNSEIEKFSANLVRGQSVLDQYLITSKDSKKITGEQAFKLYDTFGFPIELVHIMANEKGYTVDEDGFKKRMEQQKERSGKKQADPMAHVDLDPSTTTEFTGYDELTTNSEVIALVQNGKSIKSASKGEECYVIAKKAPFFIVGGGQVPDKGWLQFGDIKVPLSEVRYIGKAIAAKVKLPIDVKIGTAVTSIVNKELRERAMKNHTGTHMLQAALMQILGKHIKQSGSLVHPDYLRFDFTYHENLSPEDIKKVEDLVNEKIRENIPVNIEYTTLRDATKRGVIAFFGDKYNPDEVRIVDIQGFSAELCGGTHLHRTGEIGALKIVEVTALSAGHRRIVAVTGEKAMDLFQQTFNTVKNLSQQFKVTREEVLDVVKKQQDQLKKLQTQIKQLKKQMWKSQLPVWEQQVETVGKVPFLFLHLQDLANDELRDITSHLSSKKPGFYFLVSSSNGRTSFLSTVSSEFTDTVNMKDFASWLKDRHSLRGGGSKTTLQGGGAKFDAKIKDSIKQWLTSK